MFIISDYSFYLFFMKKLNYYALYLIVKDIVIGDQASKQ